MTPVASIALSALSLLALTAPPHPHVPRVLKLGLTQGELTKGQKEVVVPFKMVKAEDEEHLSMRLTTDGWVATTRDPTPTGGVELALAADFGTLHGRLRIVEVMDASAAAKEPAKKGDEKPKAEKKDGEEPVATIRIERDAKGEFIFRFRGQVVTQADLANLLSHTVKPVVAAGGEKAACSIQADQGVPYAKVQETLQAAAQAGIYRVTVAAIAGDRAPR